MSASCSDNHSVLLLLRSGARLQTQPPFEPPPWEIMQVYTALLEIFICRKRLFTCPATSFLRNQSAHINAGPFIWTRIGDQKTHFVKNLSNDFHSILPTSRYPIFTTNWLETDKAKSIFIVLPTRNFKLYFEVKTTNFLYLSITYWIKHILHT